MGAGYVPESLSGGRRLISVNRLASFRNSSSVGGVLRLASIRASMAISPASPALHHLCVIFTVESVCLRRYYVLFFIAHESRSVWIAGYTTNPTAVWVTQQGCNLGLDFSDRASVS